MEYEDIGLLHEIFRHQASLTPDSLAVVSVEGDNNGRNLTFSQLDELSDLLAVVLQDDGASPERIVAICLDKGVKFVVSYIAILKTGNFEAIGFARIVKFCMIAILFVCLSSL